MSQEKQIHTLDERTARIKAKWQQNEKLITELNAQSAEIQHIKSEEPKTSKTTICERCQKKVPQFHICFKCERCGSIQGSPYEIEDDTKLPSGGIMCLNCLAQYREW